MNATATLTAPCPNPACTAVLRNVPVGGRERRFKCACGWKVWVTAEMRVWDVEPWAAAIPEAIVTTEAAATTPTAKPTSKAAATAARNAAELSRKQALLAAALNREGSNVA